MNNLPEKKKRGRKPKIKPKEELNKVPKKRGRKPKIKEKTENEITHSTNVENIILNLPIDQELLDNISKTNQPEAYNKNTSLFHITDKDNLLKYNNKQKNPNLNINNNLENEIDNENINNKKEYSIKSTNLIEQIKETRAKEIEDLFSSNNFTYIDLYNNHIEFPKKTSIHCFWDGEPFDNQPFSIPFKKENNKYHMFGIFCSCECAVSYLFNMQIENNVLWERYSLLNTLYSKDNNTIKPALPKMCLKKYGGLKTIKEFRANLTKSYNIIMPPMIGIIPLLEEIDLKKSNNITNNNSGLKLKRTKPLPNHKNSLENCMQLKYI